MVQMKYWICQKCQSENTPGSTVCWKCGVPLEFHTVSSPVGDCEKNGKKNTSRQHEKHQHAAHNFGTPAGINYWVCPKCKEQFFYLVQVCPTCFTSRPENLSGDFPSEKSSCKNEKKDSEKILCSCTECGLKIRIPHTPGKHELICPACHQEFDLFVMSDRTVHFVQKRKEPKESKGKASWYEILEIKPDASKEEIKFAYRKLMNEYHPDKVACLGKELRDLAERKAKEISEAYEMAIGKTRK